MCRSAAHSGPRGPIQAHLEDSLPCDRGHGGRSLEGSSSPPWSGPSLSCSQAASWADLAPDEAREGVSRHLQTPGPFQSGPVKASPGSTISSFWFPSSAHMRQQVSRTQIIFSSPRERARFVSFCAIRRRPRRVWAGHGWVRGSLASGARWPAPSREALGSGGLGRPASYPGRVWVTRAAPPSFMPVALLVAGVRPRDPPDRPRWPPALTRSAPAGGR